MLPRFYLNSINPQNNTLAISDRNTIHQIISVLRLKKNDVFILFSPQAEYEVAIKDLSENQLIVTILERRESKREPAKKLILYQSLLKKDKFEWILQKGVELGVYTFMPIISDNSIVRKISANKLLRYQKIITEATEQCGGQRLANLEPALPFQQAIEKIKTAAGQKLLAWEGETSSKLTKVINKNSNTYHLFIGPEGGFSPSEIELAKTSNINIISLGNRILRAETAAIAATSIILLNT